MIDAALKISIIYIIVQSIDLLFLGWQCLSRPIVIAPLAGLVLGDFSTGIIMGATLESVFMGISAIGGSVPADATSASVIAVAFAILSGQNTESGLAIAMPIGTVLASISAITMSVIGNPLAPLWEKIAVRGKNNELAIKTTAVSFVYMVLISATIIFVSVAYGIDGLNGFLASMPAWVMIGLGASSGMMLAVGFAILTSMIWSKEVGIYFFLGFVLVKYANLTIIPIAIIGIAIAITIFLLEKGQIDIKNMISLNPKAATGSSEEDGFFK